MTKRCEASWQYTHKAKGSTTRCTARATHLVVKVSEVLRVCQACAKKWEELRGLGVQLVTLGVLDMQDRSNPETIRALRVKHALSQTTTVGIDWGADRSGMNDSS